VTPFASSSKPRRTSIGGPVVRPRPDSTLVSPGSCTSDIWYTVSIGRQKYWVQEDALTKDDVNYERAAQYERGDIVALSDGNEVYKDGHVVELGWEAVGRVDGPPIYEWGRLWYPVETEPRGTYWLPQNGLTIRQSNFVNGDTVYVMENVSVMSDESRVTLPEGSRGKVIGGPRAYGNVLWSQVQTKNGVYWIPESSLRDYDGQLAWSAPEPLYDVRERVKITKQTTAYALTGGREVTVKQGFTGEIIGSPVEYKKMQWYEVVLTTRDKIYQFWIPQDALTDYDGQIYQYRPGDRLRVTMKTVAWNQTGKTTINGGITGEVVNRPYPYQGELWYQIQTPRGRVWVPRAVVVDAGF
jgi:hypothetical protein